MKDALQAFLFAGLFLAAPAYMVFGAAITASDVANSVPFDNSSALINGYTATDVQDALEETHVKCFEANATATTTTTSGTDAVINSMTVTPTITGTYLVMFSTDIQSNAAGAAITVSYYLAAVQIAGTVRKTSHFDGGTLSAGSGRAAMAIQKLVAFTGANSLSVEWSTSGGTATAAARSLTACRVGP